MAKHSEEVQVLQVTPSKPTQIKEKAFRLLVINPNSSQVMTEGLSRMIDDLGYSKNVTIDTMTMTNDAPASINNEEDAKCSSDAFSLALESGRIDFPLTDFSGVLIACYSVHPLTVRLAESLAPKIPVVGIFEASISTALSLLPPPSPSYAKFGIVTTGEYWETALTKGVEDYLGLESGEKSSRFKGVFSTGLNAGELHSVDAGQVQSRIKEATKSMVKDGDCKIVCLGCAGMAGMDETVREACIEQLGPDTGRKIKIIDGVKAGIAILQGLARDNLDP